MKKWKKATTLLLSLLMTIAVALPSCVNVNNNINMNSSNSTPSNSSSSSSSTGSGNTSADTSGSDDTSTNSTSSTGSTGSTGTENPGTDDPTGWSDYEATKQPTCTETGIKTRYLLEDPTQTETADIAARGHNYCGKENSEDANGVCHVCETKIYETRTTSTNGITFYDTKSKVDGEKVISGKGEEYDRYEMSVGYYEFECLDGPVWLSFIAPEAGQYALYTVGSLDQSIEITRYNASFASTNTSNPYPARILSDGSLYSTVNAGSDWSLEGWRGTWTIYGTAGEIVRLHFVKIAEPAWEPKVVQKEQTPKQINGKVAPNGPENTLPADVPFDTKFFKDDDGYYYMGTKENKGAPIYAAITKPASRMFNNGGFLEAIGENGGEGIRSNLYLDTGKFNADGDFVIHNYVPFFVNETGEGSSEAKSTAPANIYPNYVNKDGLYPVNEELFNMLKYFTQKNRPMGMPDDYVFGSDSYSEVAWLSCCYYYKNLVPGSQELPNALEGTGTKTLTIKKNTRTYYTFSHKMTGETSSPYCTVTFSGPATLFLETESGVRFTGSGTFIAETGNGTPFSFNILSITDTDLNITFTEGYEGSQQNPKTQDLKAGTSNVSISTVEHFMADGTFNYIGYYTFTAKTNGTLSITSTAQNLLMTVSYEGTTTDEDGATVPTTITKVFGAEDFKSFQVTAGMKISVIVGPYNESTRETTPPTFEVKFSIV